MRFTVEHVFNGITLKDYEQLYFNEDFNVALCKAVNLDRALVRRDDDGKKVVRHVKVSPRGRDIPGPVAKVLGSDRIEYTEQIDYVWGANQGVWVSVSSLLTDKVDSRGTFRFVEVPGGVKRVVDGEIKVKIFGVGGMIEKFICMDVEKSYDAAADFTRKWLAEKR